MIRRPVGTCLGGHVQHAEVTAGDAQVLDKATVKMVAEAFEVEVLDREEEGVDAMARKTIDYTEDEDEESLLPRAPIVTVMGHVDHGKVRCGHQPMPGVLSCLSAVHVSVMFMGGNAQLVMTSIAEPCVFHPLMLMWSGILLSCTPSLT